jgi:hypothetical protein
MKSKKILSKIKSSLEPQSMASMIFFNLTGYPMDMFSHALYSLKYGICNKIKPKQNFKK